jgi:hypothetical protein
VSTARVVFAVRRPEAARDEIERRVAALERFYAPLSLGPVRSLHIDELSLTVGAIGDVDLDDRCLLWGAPFGARRPPAEEVLTTAGVQLGGTLVGMGMAIAWSDALARVVTAPCGPIGGYAARSDDCEAYASHAVAAALLAQGTAAVDPDAIPELIAFDFVGSGRSLVAGAVPLPAATSVVLGPDSVSADEWWPLAQRWAPVDPPQAQTYTDAALIGSIAHRTGGLDDVGLCLTGGADSRVLAVALAQLGKRVDAITWGEAGWGDVEKARPLAAALGIGWRSAASWRDDDEIATRADAEARFSDGAFGLAPSDRIWPGAAPAVMVGAAGEVGRAFYYRRLTGRSKPSEPDDLANALFPEGRLAGASRHAQSEARESAQRWATLAWASGRRGWSALDVLYAEQRVTHWGRSQVPALHSDFLAGFASVDVLRGLSSFTLSERLSDGFHRRFVEDRRPDLALPEPPAPEPLPAPPSRAARLAARLRRPEPVPPTPPPPGDALLLNLWQARPATRERIADRVLRSPLLGDALGEEWCEATREGFLAGRPAESARALQSAGPVALAEALARLQAD